MNRATLTIQHAGHCVVQDLGRPGHAGIGIPANGASDQHAARTANILVGNADDDALLEVTGSEVAFTTSADLLIAVTGAAGQVIVDGHRQPAWEALAVFAGSHVRVPVSETGYRSYVAVNGDWEVERALGSVAPDRLLGVGCQLFTGDTVVVRTAFTARGRLWWEPLFRLGAERVESTATIEIDAIAGPDVDLVSGGLAALDGPLVVTPQSDHIGLRLTCPPIELASTAEILSRGVPVGAIEVPPNGGIIMLLRGRLVTAGYPVLAVVTSESLDRLGQAGPGATVQVRVCELHEARRKLHRRRDNRRELAERVRTAFIASGLAQIISAGHTSAST
ncbi:MAG: biotin-dependent carboxyltransferase family protein [Pseudonocardiaceae bacterium]